MTQNYENLKIYISTIVRPGLCSYNRYFQCAKRKITCHRNLSLDNKRRPKLFAFLTSRKETPSGRGIDNV